MTLSPSVILAAFAACLPGLGLCLPMPAAAGEARLWIPEVEGAAGSTVLVDWSWQVRREAWKVPTRVAIALEAPPASGPGVLRAIKLRDASSSLLRQAEVERSRWPTVVLSLPDDGVGTEARRLRLEGVRVSSVAPAGPAAESESVVLRFERIALD